MDSATSANFESSNVSDILTVSIILKILRCFGDELNKFDMGVNIRNLTDLRPIEPLGLVNGRKGDVGVGRVVNGHIPSLVDHARQILVGLRW